MRHPRATNLAVMDGELAGEALTFIMDRRGVSSCALARQVGCHHSVIYQLRLSRGLPSKPLAEDIAQALSVLSGKRVEANELWAVSELQQRRRCKPKETRQ